MIFPSNTNVKQVTLQQKLHGMELNAIFSFLQSKMLISYGLDVQIVSDIFSVMKAEKTDHSILLQTHQDIKYFVDHVSIVTKQKRLHCIKIYQHRCVVLILALLGRKVCLCVCPCKYLLINDKIIQDLRAVLLMLSLYFCRMFTISSFGKALILFGIIHAYGHTQENSWRRSPNFMNYTFVPLGFDCMPTLWHVSQTLMRNFSLTEYFHEMSALILFQKQQT